MKSIQEARKVTGHECRKNRTHQIPRAIVNSSERPVPKSGKEKNQNFPNPLGDFNQRTYTNCIVLIS